MAAHSKLTGVLASRIKGMVAQGMGPSAIAAELGLPRSTVKAWCAAFRRAAPVAPDVAVELVLGPVRLATLDPKAAARELVQRYGAEGAGEVLELGLQALERVVAEVNGEGT